MRISGGIWKGRRIVASRRSALRPTTDRLKEALFSFLGERVAGATVADLCCGAGGLGLEALSRGAIFVHFVDISPIALQLVRDNLTRCQADPGCYRLQRIDARRWLARADRLERERPLIVLADPPNGETLAHELLDGLARLPGKVSLAVAAVEHEAATDLEPPETGRFSWQRRRYGASALFILEA